MHPHLVSGIGSGRRLNAAVNRVAIELSSEDLITNPVTNRADVIFLADVFYEEDLARKVMAFANASKHNGQRLLIGDPQRSYFPTDKFRKVAGYAVPVTRELEDSEIKNSAVWELLC